MLHTLACNCDFIIFLSLVAVFILAYSILFVKGGFCIFSKKGYSITVL